jgi:hypothetical protein
VPEAGVPSLDLDSDTYAMHRVETRRVVFGYSRIPLIEHFGSMLLLNSGGATDQRGQPHRTVARLTITDGVPSARRISVS